MHGTTSSHLYRDRLKVLGRMRRFIPTLVCSAGSGGNGQLETGCALSAQASSQMRAASEAEVNGAGSEQCLRGKLPNALLQLSNSCDVRSYHLRV